MKMSKIKVFSMVSFCLIMLYQANVLASDEGENPDNFHGIIRIQHEKTEEDLRTQKIERDGSGKISKEETRNVKIVTNSECGCKCGSRIDIGRVFQSIIDGVRKIC